MREDLESIYMLLFRFVGNRFQLGLCNVGWLARPRSPSFSCRIPSSSRRSRYCSTEASLVTAVKTRHTKPQERLPSQAGKRRPCLSQERPVTGETRTICARVCWEKVKTIQEALSHAPSPVHGLGDLGDEVDGMMCDTIKLRSDDDGSRKRGGLCSHLARHITQNSPFLQVVSS